MEIQIGQLLERDALLDLGPVKVQRFWLTASNLDEFQTRFARILASAYLLPLERENPNRTALLPTTATVRRGDFGEALAKVIYDQVLAGYSAPGSKLWGKPNPDTSQTGEDRVALFVRTTSSAAEPVTMESKVRTTYQSPQGLLDLFSQPTDDRTATREAAWRNTVRDLSTVDGKDTDLSYLLANAMYDRSTRNPAELPDYHLHGLLVVEPGRLSDDQISERWSPKPGMSAPLDRLVIVEIEGLTNVIDECYELAAKLRVRDLAPHPDELPVGVVGAVRPGLSQPLRIDATKATGLECPVSQSALWYLADRDGLAAATALRIEPGDDPVITTFRQLLLGDLPDEAPVEMTEVVAAVRKAWLSPGVDVLAEAERATAAAERWIEAHSEHAERMRLVTAAITSRLDRHPKRLLAGKISRGGNIEQLIDHLVARGLVGLWPSQARALSAGLLSGAPDPFIVSMPTSGGKTLLIAMSIARSLDAQPDRQVVLLANTRALVRHLRKSIRQWLPNVETVALLGEIAHTGDTCFPPEGVLARVVVTTPERFDLDWRRSSTRDGGSVDPSGYTSLIVVDEAHHIADLQRGARLEAGLSRASRAGIPVQLFSSQLGGSGDLERWLSCDEAVTSEWRPAHVHRSTFFRRSNDTEGWIRPDGGGAEQCLAMPGGPIDHADPSLAVKSRVNPSCASALALAREPEGMVLVYTPQKRSVPGLTEEVERRAKASSPNYKPSPELKKIADRLPPAAERTKELLSIGIGMHHASLTRFEHRAVEDAAEAGLLRYIVCTDTLLSGVDFPVRSVIVSNCSRGRETLSASQLNNLAGRAGRGGRFMAGELVLMTKDEASEQRILRLLAQGVPPTKSQLHEAMKVLARVQGAPELSAEDAVALTELDSFILSVVADGALEQGDLLLELEDALSATLWWAGVSASHQERALGFARQRATTLAASPPGWNRAVFRTGLDSSTCVRLREFVDQVDPSPFIHLSDDEIAIDAGDLLAEISMVATQIQPGFGRWPAQLDETTTRRLVLESWLSGQNEVEGVDAELVEKAFETLASSGSWVVGSALEVFAWRYGLSSDRLATLAGRLELSRLRTGAPSEACAQLVDGGLPRADAAELWQSFLDSSPSSDFFDYARLNLDEDVVPLIEWPKHANST